MASSVEADTEHESEPEESKRSLSMRRREATDDDDEERERPVSRIGSRSWIGSDEDSDAQGAPPDYGADESEIEDDEEELEDDVGLECEGEQPKAGVVTVVKRELGVEGDGSVGQSTEIEGWNNVEEDKKENEPFAIPTAGAFYMHDDRFRDSNGDPNR